MSILYNETGYNNYIDCLLKKDNKNLYMKYIIININIEEIDKIFNNYNISHNKKFDFYYINCEFEIVTDNNYTTKIESIFHYNTDYINIKSYLLFYIQSKGIKFFNINRLIINTISCLCNMNYDYYIKNPMSMLERRINFIINKNPELINALCRNKNHPLIKKYNHIPFQINHLN